MARRKLEERHIKKLSKVGRGVSCAVTLPIEAVRLFKWRERQKLVVKVDKRRQRITIEDWKKK